MSALRDKILKAGAIPSEDGELFGEKVTFRGLSAAEQAAIFDGRPTRELLVPVCAAGIVDEAGKPVLSEADFAAVKLDGQLEQAFERICALTRPDPETEEKNS